MTTESADTSSPARLPAATALPADKVSPAAGAARDTKPPLSTLGMSGALSLALEACGSGGSTSGAVTTPVSPLSAKESSRFLSQASLGAGKTEITRTQSLGASAWLEEQFAMPPDTSHWDWMVDKGFNVLANKNNALGIDDTLWRRLMSSPDVLRVRMALALSEIFVVGIDGLNMTFRQFAAAQFMDILERNAFGNWRKLIEEVSLSTAMGVYLSHRGNVKANAVTGQMPDENYAREIMQLFSIGLYELNGDGTAKLASGKPIETYDQADVSGLARVFTGWDYDSSDADTPDRNRRPMANIASRHETGIKQFLGVTISANTGAAQSLTLALDTLLNHANTGPFFCKQLIQRLVTSNPSPAYVQRVATVFNNSKNTGGDLKAVLRAVLLDSEARTTPADTQTSFGKLREPMLRFTQWARSFNASSPTGNWKIGSTADVASRLGQSPLRSSSVFNFFRPGYAPPGTPLGNAGMVSPELQLANESTMIGYINYMQSAIGNSQAEVKADYAAWLGTVGNTQALLDDLNLVLASGQLSASTLSTIKTAIDSIAITTPAGQSNRLYAAILLVMASPEYLVQK